MRNDTNTTATEATTAVAPAATATPAPAAPVTKKPAAKPATKPAVADKAKTVKKAAAKNVAKPATQAAKPAAPAKAKVAAKPAAPKVEKAKKPKMVRDSFTIPKNEYDVLDALKLRAAKLGNPVKKTELIRAGMKVVAALGDAAFKAALAAVPSLKTGRPAKNKKA